MSATKQLKLAGTSQGRMLLHLLALVQDHHLRWHFAGIVRELRVSQC